MATLSKARISITALVAAALVACACLLAAPAPAVAAPREADAPMLTTAAQSASDASGLTGVAKPTLAELRALYKALPQHPSVDGGMWATAPAVSAYKAGALSSESLAFSEVYLNLIRRAANLDSATFEAAANANAAQGALILARLDGGLTHYPKTPEGVTEDQAAAGKYACSTSNISFSWGYGDPLRAAIQGQMNDSSEGNMASVGHRRWLLNPATSTFGIGSAQSDSGAFYTAVKVFDSSSEYCSIRSDNSTDYDFVSWPASGAFLNDLFAPGTPWSITLNPERFATPSADAVKVVVKRLSDGKAWTLDAADSATTATGEFFSVDTRYIGVPNCIVFNPGYANLGADEYLGAYVVTVTGIQTADGAATSFSYQVDFDSARIDLASAGASISGLANKTYTGRAITQSPSVMLGGERLQAGRDYSISYANNTAVGKATVTVIGEGDYQGELTATFSIAKAANPLKAKAVSKTVKLAKGKKKLTKAQVVKGAVKITKKGQGKVTYTRVAKGSSKQLTIAKKTGEITVKKGTKKGLYKIKVRVKAAGNANYKAGSKAITCKVRVK